MVLLGDMGQEEAHFDPFGDNFNPVQDRCTFVMNVPLHGNHFEHTCWYSYVMYVKWKLVLVRLEIV
jgi:hypothetical protein